MPSRVVALQPSWRNVHGAAQTFGATLRALTGPAGATYTIGVDGASYGSVPDGEGRECTACYTATVQPAGSRPAPHWDATADERITPDTLGQDKRWTLHIGGSFSDVPPASPFYRLVETVLHSGVTGGCAAGRYCPAAAATRDQMAVFVLVAKEGAGYRPPACGTPLFGDVPAAHPLCAWIEELARRGVTSGCGAGRYCPQEPVTREQMAAFIGVTLSLALYAA